jgi:hypothetical protein
MSLTAFFLALLDNVLRSVRSSTLQLNRQATRGVGTQRNCILASQTFPASLKSQKVRKKKLGGGLWSVVRRREEEKGREGMRLDLGGGGGGGGGSGERTISKLGYRGCLPQRKQKSKLLAKEPGPVSRSAF